MDLFNGSRILTEGDFLKANYIPYLAAVEDSRLDQDREFPAKNGGNNGWLNPATTFFLGFVASELEACEERRYLLCEYLLSSVKDSCQLSVWKWI